MEMVIFVDASGIQKKAPEEIDPVALEAWRELAERRPRLTALTTPIACEEKHISLLHCVFLNTFFHLFCFDIRP